MNQQPDTISNDTTHQSMLAFHNSPILTQLKPKPELILYILINIFLMIAIANCSLYNPGPDIVNGSNLNSNCIISYKLSIYYQNVQGLIPFTELNKTHPYLDNTKLCELHAYIYEKQPDIVILNETWLKSTILDGEILPTDMYRTFRWDRTDFSHPPDPENASKFRKKWGWCLNCCLLLFAAIMQSCKLKL